MCEYCEKGREFPIDSCGNGDLGARAKIMAKAIILFINKNTASGYFDINYCPMCGRILKSLDNCELIQNRGKPYPQDGMCGGFTVSKEVDEACQVCEECELYFMNVEE